jgi:hypothetical protein
LGEQKILVLQAPVLLYLCAEQELVFSDETSFLSVGRLRALRINFVERVRYDGDHQVEHDDGGSQGVDDKQHVDVEGSYCSKVGVILSNTDVVGVEPGLSKAGLWYEPSGLSQAHDLEGVSESCDSDQEDTEEEPHVNTHSKDGSDQETSSIEDSQEVEEPEP